MVGSPTGVGGGKRGVVGTTTGGSSKGYNHSSSNHTMHTQDRGTSKSERGGRGVKPIMDIPSMGLNLTKFNIALGTFIA